MVKSYTLRLAQEEWIAIEAGLRLLPGNGQPTLLAKIALANEVMASVNDDDNEGGPSGGGVDSDDGGPSNNGGGNVIDLSRREASILRALTMGHSNKEIARTLVITESTVKVHMKAVLRKLRLRNRTQAAMWASENVGALQGGL